MQRRINEKEKMSYGWRVAGEGSREIRQHGAGGNAEPEVGIQGKMQIKQD